MIVDIDKNEFIALIQRQSYMEGYSRDALEKIFEIEEELSVASVNEYAIDGAYIRGEYSEYDTIEHAVKDLGYDSVEDLECHHNWCRLYDSVLIY